MSTTRVAWSIPIFIVRAMEHQAAAEWRGDRRVQRGISPNDAAARGVHDYVADLLFNEIQPRTVIAFRDDPAFLAAYNFPEPRLRTARGRRASCPTPSLMAQPERPMTQFE